MPHEQRHAIAERSHSEWIGSPLADFARIVEILDRTGALFVSVTQAFNTTTSIAPLTLNVLPSFAQFEREVTGERIRDKIAASKAKGMRMGGNPPLGYDVRDCALHVNDAEAAIVRDIFARYLKSRSVFSLRDELARDGIRSKLWTSSTGRHIGGAAFSHGALFHILSSRLYRGEIVHRGKAYPGQHAALIEAEVFEAVQAKLEAGAPAMPPERSVGRPRNLLGKLFDDRGSAMTSAHANKQDRRYHYYASTAVRCGKAPGSLTRVQAFDVETLVRTLIEPLLSPSWQSEHNNARRAFAAVERVVISKARLVIDIANDAIEPLTEAQGATTLRATDTHWRLEASHQLARPPHRRALIGDACAKPHVDRTLLRAIVETRRWSELLASGEVPSIAALAKQENLCPIYTGQLLPLAFLAPDLIAQIVDGRQPKRLSLSALIERALPMRWSDQRALFAQFA